MTAIQQQIQQAIAVENLIGLIPATALAGGITNDQLAGNIQASKLAGGITNDKLASNGVDGDILQSFGGAVNWYTPNNIVYNLPNPTLANVGQIIAVNGAGSFHYVSPLTYSKATLTSAVPSVVGTPVQMAHGFTGIPHVVRVVLVKTSTGGETDVQSIILTDGNSPPLVVSAAFVVFTDSTYVNVNVTTLGHTAFPSASYSLKAYVVYFS